MIFKFCSGGDLFVASDRGEILWSPYGSDEYSYRSMVRQSDIETLRWVEVRHAIEHCLEKLESDNPIERSDYKTFLSQIKNAELHGCLSESDGLSGERNARANGFSASNQAKVCNLHLI